MTANQTGNENTKLDSLDEIVEDENDYKGDISKDIWNIASIAYGTAMASAMGILYGDAAADYDTPFWAYATVGAGIALLSGCAAASLKLVEYAFSKSEE